MKIGRNYLGVLLVTLCLFGSAMFSILLNVDTESVTTTRYDYITDVTGLFEHTDTPQYIDYNPIKNYTGYSNLIPSDLNPSGLDFERSNAANNYTILINPSTSSAGPTGTVNNSTNIDQAIFAEQPVIALPPGDVSAVNPTSITTRLYDFKIASLYDWIISAFPNYADYQKIELTLTYPGGAPNGNALFCSGTYVHSGTGELMLTVIGQRSNAVQSIVIDLTNYTAAFTYTISGGSVSTRTVSLYESFICYGDARQRENYFSTEGGQVVARESYYNTVMSLSFTSTVFSGAEYAYLLPNAGVTIGEDEDSYFTTVWQNGETNGRIAIILDGWGYSDASEGAIAISFQSGETERTLGIIRGNSWTIDGQDVGAFQRILIYLDFINGKIEVKPIDFTNFVDFTVIDTILYQSDINVSAGVQSLKFEQLDDWQPLRWSIAETSVLMGVGGAMVDPTINIKDYWPDMTFFRLWIQSVAVYGSSVTINNVTYPIDSNGDITINNKSYDFNNVYLSFPIDGHVYITFVVGNTTIDLGALETDIITFAGPWYFSAGLYKGSESIEKSFNWVVGWGASANQFLLISLGLLGAGLVIVRKVYGLKMSMIDWSAVFVAAIALIGFLGGI